MGRSESNAILEGMPKDVPFLLRQTAREDGKGRTVKGIERRGAKA